MITVIVTSRASALKRELVDRHFSPCWTLPTLPTTSTETWLIFLKVFFWCFKICGFLCHRSYEMKYPSSTKLCDRSKTFIILQEEKRKASSLSVFCLSEKFHSGETRIFSELKKTDKSLLCQRQQTNWLFSGFLVQPKPRPAQSQTVEFWLNFLSTQAGRSFWIVLITRKRSIGWYLSCSNKT